MVIEKGRLGLFFLFIGFVLLLIFFTTDQSKNPQVEFFFVGVALLGLALFFIRRDWKPPKESERFRAMRRWLQKGKEKKENDKG